MQFKPGIVLAAMVLAAGALSPAETTTQTAANARQIHIELAHSVLNAGLISHDPDTRARAIAAFGLIAKTQPVRQRIEGFLSDGNEQVRIAAVNTLADLGFKRSTPALEKTMNTDPVPEVEFAAAKALYKLGDPKGTQLLELIFYDNLDTKSGYIERQKRKFFAHFYSLHRATTYLLDEGGGFVPLPGVGLGLSEIADLMSNQNLSPRATIVLMMCRKKNVDTGTMLKYALKDKDPSVRSAAALMVALTARRDLRENLVPLMSDSDARVRFRAAGAYLHLVRTQPAQKKN